VAEQVGQPSTETGILRLTWVKSSASGVDDDTACVEVATTPGHVLLRDSKLPSPTLSLTHAAWRAFLSAHSS